MMTQHLNLWCYRQDFQITSKRFDWYFGCIILGEVIQATLKYIDNPNISVNQLMKYIKGPDFPTGGIIQGIDGIKKAYETGKGKIVVRSKVDEEALRNGRKQLIVTEIPYEVNKSSLVKRIDELRADKKSRYY